ncbi:tyrosine-type recombinase/integrase [Halobellus ruber]|uniref:Tyrosine-type recombinase/integrase n=1 Tax=Halobellus ruber TaxID=2761102 RepID=A0A7J9SLT8_9EURY|nr:tyrosine-type recombinase/integrase [Halobellus ruber]MBB6647910.1 tyrosine-type recombinase/integrase [Halobellus ruber]
MGEQNPPGREFRPLNREQFEAFDSAAQATNDPLTKLTTRTIPYTGLRNGEFCHLRANWLKEKPKLGVTVLSVPQEEKCTGGIGTSDGEKDQSTRERPCYECRNNRQGRWRPSSQYSVRKIPIEAEPVCELLRDWFSKHEEIPILRDAVARRVKSVADEAGIDRKVTPRDLRETYGMILASKGFSREAIRGRMGLRHGNMLPSTNDISVAYSMKFSDNNSDNNTNSESSADDKDGN